MKIDLNIASTVHRFILFFALCILIDYRCQKPLTLYPPELSLILPTIEFSLRQPLNKGVRHTLAVVSASGFTLAISISDSNANISK
jgi:hypothetical protein